MLGFVPLMYRGLVKLIYYKFMVASSPLIIGRVIKGLQS